jgi:hypothetical protein
MDDDLVRRLSSIADILADLFPEFSKDINSATDRIEQLEAALRPFAELGEAWLPVDGADNSIFVTCPDSTPVNNITNFGFTFGSFRNAARAALGEKKDG